MDNTETVSQLELGQYLTSIRERAGVKQAELARKITWSPALLSRVEAGDRLLASDELHMLLDAIGTPDASQLKDILQRNWEVLPRPALSHPEKNLLWNAEQVAQNLNKLRSQPDIKKTFEHRLSEYIQEIKKVASLLLKREYQIAFIGSIGIGKSTAICRLTGLEVPSKDGGQPQPVLETGAGGITICEVHLRTGPAYGLMIEPRRDDEIRANVADFVEFLIQGRQPILEEQGVKGDSQGVSKEIGRAIWNMAGFKIHREKSADGKTTIRHDEAKQLAQQITDSRELNMTILSRMELHKRDRRDIWHDSSTGKSPLTWLKDIFESINNGRHPEFSLPKRIEVIVPDALLGMPDISVRIIDTKGIDRTSARADLECQLDEPHTIAILCSGFNNAPSAEARLLLERAIETGVSSLATNTALLVLPRPDEALAVRDEAGIQVETAEEGYELKGEQIGMSIQPLGLQHLPVGFFNSREDSLESLRLFLSDRINGVRKSFNNQMCEIIENANKLLENYEKEQTQEVIKHAAIMLKSWVVQHDTFKRPTTPVQNSLLDQIKISHHNTIRASINRRGEWDNLSYSHHLGYGARRIAVISLQKSVDGFSTLCKTMVGNSEYEDAIDFINQIERLLTNSYEELLRKVQLIGKAIFRDSLNDDMDFWARCRCEYGQGYCSNILEYNREWFEDSVHKKQEDELLTLIAREWSEILRRITLLLENN